MTSVFKYKIGDWVIFRVRDRGYALGKIEVCRITQREEGSDEEYYIETFDITDGGSRNWVPESEIESIALLEKFRSVKTKP